jgi:VanZ family protein
VGPLPITPPSDRAGERQVVIAGVAKPAVLRRATIRRLCLACLAVILYGTLGPLGGAGQPWLAPVAHFAWQPPRCHCDFNDVLTNFVVYVPVGIAFRLLLRRRGRAGWGDFCGGLLLSALLSYGTELLQQVMPARSSNLNDVVVNTLAAGCGCLLAVPAQHLLRALHAFLFRQVHVPWRLWALLAAASTGGTGLLMTMPWRLGTPHFDWQLHAAGAAADVRRAALFAVIGFFGSGALWLRSRRPGDAVRAALLTGFVAVLLEGAQAFCRGHVATAGHALLAVIAGAVGAVVAPLYLARLAAARHAAPAPRGPRQPPEGVRHVAVLGLVAVVFYLLATTLSPLSPHALRAEPDVQWTPFAAEFAAPFWEMAAETLERMTIYGLLTLSCLFATAGRGPAVALILLLGLVGALELAQAFMATHGANTTTLFLAGMAWLLTVRAWHAIYPPHTSAPRASSPEPLLA